MQHRSQHVKVALLERVRHAPQHRHVGPPILDHQVVLEDALNVGLLPSHTHTTATLPERIFISTMYFSAVLARASFRLVNASKASKKKEKADWKSCW